MLTQCDTARGAQSTAEASVRGGSVALARAFLREDADVLILDEPSSGLDAQLEHALHQRLHRLRARKLTLLISHRLNALRDADIIIVVKDGRIAEAGTHNQLLKRSGHYAELFTLQACGYQETQPDDAVEHPATEPTASVSGRPDR